MPSINELLDAAPFSLPSVAKRQITCAGLRELTDLHRQRCPEYGKILDLLGYRSEEVQAIADIPFVPVRLFKEFELLSIDPSQIFKTMTSSGTTGSALSRIYLDKETATLQSKVLAKIVTSLLGKKRLPMLIIDSPSILKDRRSFSARGAGILGFSLFGYDVTYALDENMDLDLAKVEAFIEKHQGEMIFLFGFTFMIWQYFYRPLETRGRKIALENGTLLHGGGWKKLADQAVSNSSFKNALYDRTGMRRIHNYYGMVEQTGSIYLECESGHLHAPVFSDIITRDHRDFSALPNGHPGLIQAVSLLPLSYPGHSLLTEDLGTILGEDDCPCGRLGKYFEVTGRIKNAETRGCSDAYVAGI